jgi:uncharacterized phiE125 gp8 family phage protein
MALYLVTPPDLDEVLTLDEIKAHLRIDDDEDQLLATYRAAAIGNIDGRDGWLGRALGEQVWDVKLGSFPDYAIWLPLPPLIAVTSITYYDAGDVLQTMAAGTNYLVGGAGGQGKAWIIPADDKTWPSTSARPESVTVRIACGYEAGGSPAVSTLPAPIKVALLRMIGSMHEQREDIVVGVTAQRLPSAIQALLAPLRVW